LKNLCILGSTGSIGKNALAIAEKFPDRFAVIALAAKESVDLLCRQIEKFRPDVAVVYTEKLAKKLKARLSPDVNVRVLFGKEGYREAATHEAVDTVVAAMVGAAGLPPTLSAIYAGKDIALANKETLVMAGELVMKAVEESGVTLFPVDSEHSAIFQCLEGNRKRDMKRILLTGSGGPFRTLPQSRFQEITVEDALNHPNWEMGRKITIDSSTMMNKGLEVIEAKWLFGVSVNRIQVVIHPRSIVHSMVAFKDGAVIAQLGVPDMKGAIAYALSHPERLDIGLPEPDFPEIGSLEFEAPDFDKFPCLAMAFDACETGHTLPAVLNAANEIAVAAFLDRQIPYTGIPETVRRTMEKHGLIKHPSLSDLFAADRWARRFAAEVTETIDKENS